KENVIIGKLIPAGTGCQGTRPQNDVVAQKAKELRAKRQERRAKANQDEEFNRIAAAKVEEPDIYVDEFETEADVFESITETSEE
ncbi:MAG: hypothetical protein KBT48_04215, partial [Firmicutes bacterium]|nr:hypothetical protein [Bacillota bacterium]